MQKSVNPFLRFSQDADKDPFGEKPVLKNTDTDNATLLIKRYPTGEVIDNQPVSGSVNIVADLVDKMSSDLAFATSPYQVGYYIKGPAGSHGVKTKDKPYMLVTFDDGFNTRRNMPEVYDIERKAVDPADQVAEFNNFIVTHTKGEDGKLVNVDDSQFWKTNAEDDNSADTVDYANFSTKFAADKNAAARFKDGDYEVHIIASDVIHSQEDLVGGKLRIDNFVQDCAVGFGGIPSPGGSPTPGGLQSDAPWVPELNAAPVVAAVGSSYPFGSQIGVEGHEYYPNLAMNAYLVPHKTSGWLDGDSLTANAVASGVVQSDEEGTVPLTQIWLANQPGSYDVIIDYDNDGKFSWSLDGLSAVTIYVYDPVALDD